MASRWGPEGAHLPDDSPTRLSAPGRVPPARTPTDIARLPDRSGPLPLSFAQQRLWFLERLGRAGTPTTCRWRLRLDGRLDGDALRRGAGRHGRPARGAAYPLRRATARAGAADRAARGGVPAARHDDLTGRRRAGGRAWPGCSRRRARAPVRPGARAADPRAGWCALGAGRARAAAHDAPHRLRRLVDGRAHPRARRRSTPPTATVGPTRSRRCRSSTPTTPPGSAAGSTGDGPAARRRRTGGSTCAGAPDAAGAAHRPTRARREQDYRGARVDRSSSTPTLTGRAARRSAAAHGATLFMTLLAAWAACWPASPASTTWSSARPSPTAAAPRLESLIGFFVNTLALRIDLAGEPTVAELLHRVRELTPRPRYDHQDLPFEQVVELVNPTRSLAPHAALPGRCSPGRTREERGAWTLPGLSRSTALRGGRATSAKFDLSLDARRDAPAASRRPGVRHRPVRRAHGRAHRRLPARAAGRDGRRRRRQPVDRLPLLTDGRARAGCSRVERDRDARTRPSGCVHELFEEQVGAHAGRGGASSSSDEPLTYARAGRARQPARAPPARAAASGPDARVGVCLRALARSWSSRCWPCSRPAARTCRWTRPTRPSGWRTCSPTAAPACVAHATPRSRPGSAATAPRRARPRRATPPLGRARRTTDARRSASRPDDLAYVIYTSGSTGRPRA